ncbi:type II toxin-antitoxin system CcdA family antitoxin [Novosphingobium lentum]|uniref:type II toxin-antitoxin system CcdA family antitoxin n=1 Tax=Novosphingobium lentum TaxID=145287 RepID=UPI000B22E3D4|nr:type II toxin-antitoxin system CcdA family antitoxin [Novosphingobium lentum]
MQHPHDVTGSARKATNVSLDVELVGEARRLGLNISRACEAGLADQIAREKARQWKLDNAGAVGAWNGWVEENGLPLSGHRPF